MGSSVLATAAVTVHSRIGQRKADVDGAKQKEEPKKQTLVRAAEFLIGAGNVGHGYIGVTIGT
jgi:hypothetical protein